MTSRIAPFAFGLLLVATPLLAQELLYRDGPLPRGHNAAFDPFRNRLVVLGAQGDLHEYDGQRWLHRPMMAHDFRGGVIAFHVASRRTVAFGYDNSYALGTFDWDGASWRRLAPATSPPVRHPSSPLVYDSIRGRIVMFGGVQPNGPQPVLLGDTWEWDGVNWLQRLPSISPPPRTGEALAFDSVRGVTVLFGGETGPAQFGNDLWEWDGTNWRQVILASSPPARLYPAMAFAAARSRTVLFGGHSALGNPNSDLWEYDGTSWTQVPATTPWPAPRTYHTLTAVGGNELILAGGSDATGWARDVWAWDGVAWTARPALATLPPPRQSPVLAIDPVGGGAIMLGAPFSGSVNDTWRWDGRIWSQAATGGPPLRWNGAGWTQGASVYLFGGQVLGGPVPVSLNDTWRWNGSSWSAVVTATSPPARYSSAIAYDAARARAVMFGGRLASGAVLADTWTFDGSNWQLRNPAMSPAPRHEHAMAADPSRGRVVLFGGYGFDDTWEWDGVNWAQINTVTRPPAQNHAAMAFDVRQNRVVLVRQTASLGYGLWTYDGIDWAPLAVAPNQFFTSGGSFAAAGWPTNGGVLISDGTYLFELSTAPARVEGFGTSCGTGLAIAGRTRPQLGAADFGIDVIGAAASAPLVLVAATAPASLPIGPCTLLVAPGHANVLAVASPSGFASLRMAIPASPALFGLAVFVQAAALDPTMPAGFGMSAGLRIIVGD